MATFESAIKVVGFEYEDKLNPSTRHSLGFSSQHVNSSPISNGSASQLQASSFRFSSAARTGGMTANDKSRDGTEGSRAEMEDTSIRMTMMEEIRQSIAFQHREEIKKLKQCSDNKKNLVSNNLIIVNSGRYSSKVGLSTEGHLRSKSVRRQSGLMEFGDLEPMRMSHALATKMLLDQPEQTGGIRDLSYA